ncbi:MAG: prepilin-type N-terminal cleavage/methylation domain-containing protein [Candidatus Peribacteraceae bacterium]|nr:prepilin-type N-terminal cleavage/methylation domain-containing protein [Candidatus Peribacteraceae bacterium]
MLRRPAFTLLELLLVLGVLGVLAAIVLIAINPTKQLESARSTGRSVSVRELENAIVQYLIDGNTLSDIPAIKSQAKDVCQDTVRGAACTDPPVSGYDLSALIPSYLVDIPIDPNETGAILTGYRIYRLGSFVKICSLSTDAECGT